MKLVSLYFMGRFCSHSVSCTFSIQIAPLAVDDSAVIKAVRNFTVVSPCTDLPHRDQQDGLSWQLVEHIVEAALVMKGVLVEVPLEAWMRASFWFAVEPQVDDFIVFCHVVLQVHGYRPTNRD